jgi:hypothetical protein
MSCLVVALSLICTTAVAAIDPSKWIEVKGGSWKPDATMLSEIERALKSAVPIAAVNRGAMPPWTAYTFQFQGRSQVMGPRYIVINAFCEGSRNDSTLKTTWVRVFDGGPCYFSAQYEPDSKRLYDLVVNGQA